MRIPSLVMVVLAAGTAAAGAAERVTVPAASRVWFVDQRAAAGGDGTRSAPFAVLTLAQEASAPGDAIVVLTGDGSDTGYNDGIRLKERQLLLGAGVEVALADGTVLPATGSPAISNFAGAGVVLASGTVVAGIAVAGAGGDGIAGDGIAGASLRDLRVSAAGGAGIALRGCTGAVAVQRALVEGTGASGVSALVPEGELELVLRDVTVEDAQRGDGVALLVEGSGRARLTVDGGAFRRNRLAGVRALADGGGFARVEVAGSTFVGGNAGVELHTEGSGVLEFDVHDNASFTDIAASIVSVAQGADTASASSLSGAIARNAAMGKAATSGHGIRVSASGAGTLTALLDGNVIAGGLTVGNAILAEASEGGGALNVTIVGNSVTVAPTAGPAILVRAADGASVCAEISGNTAHTGEDREGIRTEQAGGPEAPARFALAGLGGDRADAAAAERVLAARNPDAGRVGAAAVTAFVAARDGCPQPLPAAPSR